MAVWLLTNQSPFWSGPALQPSHLTVLGWTKPARSPRSGVGSVSLADVRRIGAAQVAQQILAAVPASASILVHFDIDVLADAEFPASYFPHADGLTMSEIAEVLGAVLNDHRVRIVEISEYASLRDLDRVQVSKLMEMFSGALRTAKTASRSGIPE